MGIIIKILDQKKEEDVISGDLEDSFTLETFEFYCNAFADAEPKNSKQFIIARVQTHDPKMPDKVIKIL